GGGDGEHGPGGLRPAGVQLEDLPVPPAVAQVVLGDLPQAFVEPAVRRFHYVDLFRAMGPCAALLAVRRGVAGLGAVAARRVPAPRVLPRPEPPAPRPRPPPGAAPRGRRPAPPP